MLEKKTFELIMHTRFERQGQERRQQLSEAARILSLFAVSVHLNIGGVTGGLHTLVPHPISQTFFHSVHRSHTQGLLREHIFGEPHFQNFFGPLLIVLAHSLGIDAVFGQK
jgi:hypothetical protein